MPKNDAPAAAPKKTAKPVTSPPVKKPAADRPVLYPEIMVRRCQSKNGTALTREQNRDLLGWQEETDEVKFGEDYLLVDNRGKKIRCTNNATNRPIRSSQLAVIEQEVLTGNYAPKGPNGETISFDPYGEVTDGQHRMLGFENACQTWEADEHWRKTWPEMPVIDTLLVFGIDGSPETLRTIGQVAPRTIMDVLFQDRKVFGKVRSGDRKALARSCDYAIRFVRHRTGADRDAYTPKMTHSVAVDFLSSHDRIKRFVKHVFDESQPAKQDKGPAVPSRLTKLLPPGTLSGLLYLMASCHSDGAKYRKKSHPNENGLDWSAMERAEEYVVALASDSKDVAAVGEAVATLYNTPGTLGGNPAERLAIVIKGWNVFKANKPIKPEHLALEYEGELDERDLVNLPAVGGIDRGEPEEEAEPEETAEVVAETEAAKADVKTEAAKPKKNPAYVKLLKELEGRRAENPGKLLFCRNSAGGYVLYGECATTAGSVLHLEVPFNDVGMPYLTVPATNLQSSVRKLSKAGHEMMELTEDENGFVTATDLKPQAAVNPPAAR